ncbi:beta-carboxysome assembly chaperone CcmS [Trichothermofontia sp.]
MMSWDVDPPMSGGSPSENRPVKKVWVEQLEAFVRNHQHTLAALNWALYLEQGAEKDTIGVDFEPTPHLVFCRREAIATLNEQVNNQLREIIGILNGHKPEQEVFILGIGPGQSCEFKLIQFQPDPAPPTCYEQRSGNPSELVVQLEGELNRFT